MELWAPGFYLLFSLVNNGLRGDRSYEKYFNSEFVLFVKYGLGSCGITLSYLLLLI